jgi:hypothetical protein
LVSVASAQAEAPIEGVWTYEDGKIEVTAGADGTLSGTVVAATSFSGCSHEVGEVIWSGISPRADGSYWGLHQWFKSPSCAPVATLGLAAWRVLSNDGGVAEMVFCTNPPGDTSQPEISPSGETSGASECHHLAPIPDTAIASGPSGATASAAATFAFTSTQPGSFECRLDSAPAWSACSSPVSYAGLAQGPHNFEVRAEDVHGNADPSPATASWSVDTVAPDTSITSGPSGATASASASFAFTATEPASFECRLDSGSKWTHCASPESYGDLADGNHSFEVRAKDALGNTDASPASASFNVDTQPPNTTIISFPGEPISSALSSATFAFASSASGATFECRLDGGIWAPCTSPVSYGGLAAGVHVFEVRAVDRLGVVDPSSASVSFRVDTPVNGARVAVTPLKGKVRVRVPGDAKFRPLVASETIPVGSLVDTTEGKVLLTSINADGEEQSAAFSEGIFRVGQALGKKLVTLKLRDGVDVCAGSSSATTSGSRGGRLWGSGHGSFRTEGNDGAATVRGTIWLTEDRCEGTFFKVRRGIVAVRDYLRAKTIAVPAGQTYLARSGG